MLDVQRALKAAQVPARTHTLPLSTPWGEAIASAGDGAPILPEHPRPTMKRAAYTMLNGMWECAFSPLHVPLPAQSARDARVVGARPGALKYDEALHAVSTATPPITFGSRIRVPFSPEAPLSGVNRVLQPNELLWYRRMLELPVLSSNDRLILHFEAVDWVCAVYVNGQLAKTHRGAYLPFDVDATPHLCPASEGRAELMLCVYDPSDAGVQPRGKQSLTPGGIWYTAQSGIWQSVWYEVVPAAHLTSLSLNGAADGSLTVDAQAARAEVSGQAPDLHLELTMLDHAGAAIIQTTLPLDERGKLHTALTVDNPHLWSPSDPYLYQVKAVLRTHAAEDSARTRDIIESYCAFRTVSIERDAQSVPRFFLNGKPYFVKGILDQGYWPDGLMTAPSDEALVHDIAAMKAAGFNMMRKHFKIECARWYYHCDRLGMLVWQDAVQGGGPYSLWHISRKPTVFKCTWGRYRDDVPHHRTALASTDVRYQLEWNETCTAMVRLLACHPSIVTWTLFNEGMGQFDARAAAEHIHGIDPTRPIDAASGWFDQHCGDYLSQHNYFRPLTADRDHGRLSGYVAKRGFRALFLSEFGGWGQPIEGHRFSDAAYGYGEFDGIDEWREAVRSSLAAAEALEERGLAGYVYTQISDVEDEVNGLLTYDRRVNKLDVK